MRVGARGTVTNKLHCLLITLLLVGGFKAEIIQMTEKYQIF